MFPWPHLTNMGTHHWLLSSSDVKDTINLSGHPLRIWSSIIWYLSLGLWSHLFYSQFRSLWDPKTQPSQIWDLDYRIKNLSAIVYFPWDDHKASETQHMSSSSYSPKHDASLLCKSGTLLSSNCGILVNSLSIPTSSQTQHPDTSSLSFHLSSPFLLLCFVVFLLP